MSDKKTNWQDSAQKNSLNTFRSTFSSLIKMTLKNVKSELAVALKSSETFGSARRKVISQKDDIITQCSESIVSAVSSTNPDNAGNKDNLLKEANEKAENAGKMLKKLQSSMGNDYGRWWKRDLHVLLVQAEQEVVEAFSTLAVIKQEEIPPRDILFRSQDPNSYLKTKKYVRVSDEAYVYGLLDCIGELKRVALNSDKSDHDLALHILEIMRELFRELEPFSKYSNSFKILKLKIDVNRNIITDTEKSLK